MTWTTPILTTPARLRSDADLALAQSQVSADLGAQVTARGLTLWGWLVSPRRGESAGAYARRATATLAHRWAVQYGDGIDAASVEAARWLVARLAA